MIWDHTHWEDHKRALWTTAFKEIWELDEIIIPKNKYKMPNLGTPRNKRMHNCIHKIIIPY
jgi:hypothetical protein